MLTTQTVMQTSSPCMLRSKTGGPTEAFTAEDAEHAESETQDSFAILVSRHLVSRYLCGLSECNERARGKACGSRRGTELFHHEGHEEHEGGKGTAHKSTPIIPDSVDCALQAQLTTRFASSSNSILRVLRALRGEFSWTSGLASQPAFVPHEPKCEDVTHSKRRRT
jgi:hypothetical protein